MAITIEANAMSEKGDAGEDLRKGMASDEDPAPSALRFGVRQSDGSTASTLDHVADSTTEPTQPCLSTMGGPGFKIDGPRLHTRQTMWLWPRPTGKFEVAAEWPWFGIHSASLEVGPFEV
ncbi:hypothetical protein ABZ863_13115 [Saccharomonospora sp. NPDC046836]|uniref:hypothetical protein n=1 Tax=Saccharomonospora sp. NPDC046836 TaxID=3156921 RepID=UPI00340B9B43